MADRHDPPPSPEDVPHEDHPPRVIHLSLLSSAEAPLDQRLGGGDRVARADEGNVPAAQARPAESILQSVARADKGNGPAAQARPAEGITGDENPASAELPPAAHPTPAAVPPERVFHAKGGISDRQPDMLRRGTVAPPVTMGAPKLVILRMCRYVSTYYLTCIRPICWFPYLQLTCFL